MKKGEYKREIAVAISLLFSRWSCYSFDTFINYFQDSAQLYDFSAKGVRNSA